MAAIILEKQRERISGDTLGNLPDHVKPAVDEFIERLELITGLDIDGDGMEGNDVRTQVERSATGGGSELTEEQEAEVAMWTLRLKNVEENLREHEEAERQAKISVATAAPRDDLRRHAAAEVREDARFSTYHEAVQATVEARTNVWVSAKTHGRLFNVLHNLADGCKKSAKQARMETRGNMDAEAVEEGMHEVHKFQVRSFVIGGQVMFVKAFAPTVFCKIRAHFGLSYEAYVRQTDVSVEGLWQSGDFFFSSKANVCYKRIRPEERKVILDLLVAYDKHITATPFTLLPQWYGLYRVEGPGQEDMEFLACNNLFHCIDSIELLYDIKGCWDRSGHMERRIGHHYPNPVGCIYDRRSLDPAQPLPHEFTEGRVYNDTMLRHLLHTGGTWARSSALVLHEEQRRELLETLRHDTLWLAAQGYYNYAVIVGAHKASPFDNQVLRAVELNSPSRFGGLVPIEDTYHIGIVGPFKKWDAVAKSEYMFTRMKGRDRSSILPPDLYARRLREEMFEVFLQFDLNVDYGLYRQRQIARFSHEIQYEKLLRKKDPHLSPARRQWLLDAYVMGDVQTACLEGLGIDPLLNPDIPCLQFLMLQQRKMSTKASDKAPPAAPPPSLTGGSSVVDRMKKMLPGVGGGGGGDGSTGDVEEENAALKFRRAQLQYSARSVSFGTLSDAKQQGRKVALEPDKSGLGIVLGSTRSNRVVISRCEPRRSAALSGKLQTGDVLVEVRRISDGKWVFYDVEAKTCQQVKGLLTGEVGELFGLKVRRFVDLGHEGTKEVEIDVVLRNKYQVAEEEEEAGEERMRKEEAKALVVQETSEFLLMRLNAQIELSRHLLEEAQDNNEIPLYVSPAEELIPWVEDLDELDDLLERCVHGAFYFYRSPSVPGEIPGWFPFGIAYYDHDAREVQHNVVYMVKRDPAHTVQVVQLGGWGQHPDDPWLGYNQWVTTSTVPWLLSPSWLLDEGELFASIAQLVGSLPMLRKLVDLDDPPLRPPPKREERAKTPEVEVLPDPSLYDVWLKKQESMGALTGEKRLLKDMQTGIPLHINSQGLREEEKTALPLSASTVVSMVRPQQVMQHLEAFYPDKMGKVKQGLEMALNKPEGLDAQRDALVFPRAGTNEIRTKLLLLKANSEGLHASDWRERMFILRDGILCFVSEKKRSILKRVCDVKRVTICTSGKIGPYQKTITMIYTEGPQEIEQSVTLATTLEEDFSDWVKAMSKHSHCIKYSAATF